MCRIMILITFHVVDLKKLKKTLQTNILLDIASMFSNKQTKPPLCVPTTGAAAEGSDGS